MLDHETKGQLSRSEWKWQGVWKLRRSDAHGRWRAQGADASEGPWGWRIAMGMGSSETEGTMAEQNMLTGGFTTKRTKAKC